MFLEVTMLNGTGAALGYDVSKTQRRDTGFDGVENSEGGRHNQPFYCFLLEQLPNQEHWQRPREQEGSETRLG